MTQTPPRWPRGTPVAPGGRGPGGGRFRSYRITGFHGRHDARNPADLDMVFVDPRREGAEQYASSLDDDAPSALYNVEFEAENPLHIRTAQQFGEAWGASGAAQSGGPFHGAPGGPSSSRTFMEWVRAQGYDALVIHPEAFETDDQAAWELIAGTYGDPQSVILTPARATFIPIGPDWVQQVSARLPEPGGLRGLVPPDTDRYGQPATEDQEKRIRELFDFRYSSHGRTVVSDVRDVRVRRDPSSSSIIALGGLRLNGAPAGRWEVVVRVDDGGSIAATVNDLRVRGSLHGQGIGSGWVRGVEQTLAAAGAQRISLFDASEDIDGRSFWEHMGYTQRAGWDPGNFEKKL